MCDTSSKQAGAARIMLCTICSRRRFCQQLALPHEDHNSTVPVCEDALECIAEWVVASGLRNLRSAQQHLAEMMLYSNERIGQCSRCNDRVYTSHSRVELHGGETTLLMHYSCFIQKLTDSVKLTMYSSAGVELT